MHLATFCRLPGRNFYPLAVQRAMLKKLNVSFQLTLAVLYSSTDASLAKVSVVENSSKTNETWLCTIKSKKEVSKNNFNAKESYRSGKGMSHQKPYGTEHRNMGKALELGVEPVLLKLNCAFLIGSVNEN